MMNDKGLKIECPNCGADRESIEMTWTEKRYASVFACRDPDPKSRRKVWLLPDDIYNADSGGSTITCLECNFSSKSQWRFIKEVDA